MCSSDLWDLTWALNNRTHAPDYYGPDFTACFQTTVLVWIPCAFLWLLGAPFEIVSRWGKGVSIKSESTTINDQLITGDGAVRVEGDDIEFKHQTNPIRRIPWTKLSVAKFGLGAMLVVLHVLLLIDLQNGFGVGLEEKEPVVYMGPIYSQLLRIVTLVSSHPRGAKFE